MSNNAANSANRGLTPNFPIRIEDDSYVSRREFTKFLGLTSLAFFLGTFIATLRKLWNQAFARDSGAMRVANIEEIPVGGYKLFRYPTGNDSCILLRLDREKFVAFKQSCTHLTCPVHFVPTQNQLVCPCHHGYFSAEDGRPLAGPPRRPLARLAVLTRHDQIWVQPEDEHT